jgi:uncharacterized protein YjbI with pentapeptide repeats
MKYHTKKHTFQTFNLNAAIIFHLFLYSFSYTENPDQDTMKMSEPDQASINKILENHQSSGVSFVKEQFININLTQTNLKKCDFSKAYIYRSNFSEANMSSLDLYLTQVLFSDFSKVDLTSSNLYRAYFSNTILIEADFSNAEFNGADFFSCDLTCTDFSGADISSLNPLEVDSVDRIVFAAYHRNENAILYTEFNNCTLDYAIFDNATLPEGLTVKSATGTRWPDGYSTATLTITHPNPPDLELKKIQDEWLKSKFHGPIGLH